MESNAAEKVENNLGAALGLGGGLSPAHIMNQPGFPGGRGTGEELSSADTVFKNLRWFLVTNFRQMLAQAYAELGLIQTIVDVPVEDALRGGLDIKSAQLSETEIQELNAALERDGDLRVMATTAKWARLFGGGGTIVMVEGEDPATPLDIDLIDQGTNVQFRACDLWELSCDDDAHVPEDGDYAEGEELAGELGALLQFESAKYYNYYGVKIHRSRILRQKGKDAPSFIKTRLRGWGLSVVEVLVRSINQYLKATDVSFEVLDEFKVDVFQFNNLINTLLAPGGEMKIAQRVETASRYKNYKSALVLDALDKYESKQLSFAGLAEVMQGIKVQVAADLRMPLTKLFGVSATGFNSGQDDIEVYNGMVESSVRTPMKFDLIQLIKIKCATLFGFVPDDLSVGYKPLRVLSALDEENVKTQKFNRLVQAKERGEITTKEFRDACNRGGLLDITLDVSDAAIDEVEEDNQPEMPIPGMEDDEDEEQTDDDNDTGEKQEKRGFLNWRRRRRVKNEFDESKVKRDDGGQFASTGGSGGGKGKEKKPKAAKPGAATIADNGQIKITRPKSVEQASALLESVTKFHADAEKAVEENPSTENKMRLQHAAKQFLRGEKLAKEVLSIATEGREKKGFSLVDGESYSPDRDGKEKKGFSLVDGESYSPDKDGKEKKKVETEKDGVEKSVEKAAEGKKRIGGKLNPKANWKIQSSFHVDDISAHGEGNGQTCAHCNKGIKSCMVISSDEGDETVGLDCAEALLSGEAKEKVQQYAKKEVEKSKEILKTVKSIEKSGFGKNRETRDKIQEILGGDEYYGGENEAMPKDWKAVVSAAMRRAMKEDNDKFKWTKYAEDVAKEYKGETKKNTLGAVIPITTTTHVSKKKAQQKYMSLWKKKHRKKKAQKHANETAKVQLMPDQFSMTERMARAVNSSAYDRAAYAADGGDNWIEPGRAPFFKERPVNADEVLWRKAENASREAFGQVKWQFVVWFYKKCGGTL